ncbi:uncharacterized protein LOC133283756 [Gastrolobium bilobum]|uniref:uncharacterized protein LOC133283756 n=1 Tax=Gastrolobium bilobum TaxID=150636 RepID=UPI002AAF3F0B|nr:uncharacterized protein LOC133283756 [Gastrolobium bilobum]
MESQQQQQEDERTIPIKVLVDKDSNKVVAVEATKDFVDTLFSFLSLPLATIIRLLTNNQQLSQSPFLGNITNLYQSVQNLTPNDFLNHVCQQMLLHPRNPCEALCLKLFFNVDDTEPTTELLVCDSCNKFTTFPNLDCICGKPITYQPHNLDSEGQGNSAEAKGGVFLQENGSTFMVFDDLKIVPSSLVTSLEVLLQLGYSDLTQLEEVTHNLGKQEILNLLKYTLTSHEPLTNTILASNSKKKDNPPNQFASAIRVKPPSSDSKMEVKLVRSKSQKKIIFAEAKEDFVDFMFSFLTIPLGSIVKLLGGYSSVGCVDNLYKSVETLDSSWCTDSRSVLLDPGVAPQFGCPNQPLNIPDRETPNYYYGTGTFRQIPDYRYEHGYRAEVVRTGGVISKSQASISNVRSVTALDPRSPNRSLEGVVGFVNRPSSYAVGDDLKVKSMSAISCLSYVKESSLPLDDLEVNVISISEAEALSLLGASLTSKFTLTGGLEDFLNAPKQESTLTSK